MKIVVVGAGRVGTTLAESLVNEQNDITLIDVDANALQGLQDRLDLRAVVGNATQPSTLRDAGIEDADMLIAVTPQDETNLVICRTAHLLFRTPTKIARIRGEFQEFPELLGENGFCVDHVILPEQSVVDTIHRLIEFPEALQVLEFADGLVSLIAVRAYADGPLVKQPIRELRAHLPDTDSRIVALFRRGQSIVPNGDTLIEPGDEVFFVAATENIRKVMGELRRMDKPVKRIMVAGGGKIGLRLAKSLGNDYEIKIIEPQKARSEYLATQVPAKTLVLRGDATDEDLLADENVGDMDLFVSVTSDDENNIMASLLAKRMGAKRTIALINRQAYAELMEGSRIDIAIVPAVATIGDLLRYVRRADVARVHSLRRGAAEALEAIAHGDKNSSRVIGRRIEELKLPRGTRIGAMVRKNANGDAQVLMAHHDTVIEAEDHVIMFLESKKAVSQVEKLFQVGVGFF
jgi:trk system potassium uptake protein